MGKDCYLENLCPGRTSRLEAIYSKVTLSTCMDCGWVSDVECSPRRCTPCEQSLFAGKCHLLDISLIFSSDTEQASPSLR